MQAKAARTPSDRRSSRDRSAQPPMLDLIDAARSRRNGQPKAWQEWPCDAVAALPPVGEARRRADAGTPAPKGEISGLHPRAVFPREAAPTRRLEGSLCRSVAPNWGSLPRSKLAATYTREVGVGVDRIWEMCSIGSTCRHCTRRFDHVRLVETGGWGWRVELTKAAGRRMAMEQRVDRVNARYCARTFAGNGAGAEIWTLLEALGPQRTAV
jgi:hypothetical protein